MQLYAKKNLTTIVFAEHAVKHVDYTCIECAQVVRLRSGMHRQPHFYHLRPNDTCNQHGKSMTHLMLQCHLHTLLPPNEAQLEYRFPSINRIADVAWHDKNIIFEIQCSPIAASEILARNADYASLGFQVIWILHENRFNQWRISAAEHVLSNLPHYFTNMNSEGKGMIYEQLSINHQGIRKERAIKLPVNLRYPQLQTPIDVSTPLPQLALKKLQQGQLSFEGDTVYECIDYLKNNIPLTEYLQSLSELELRWQNLLNPVSLSSMSLSIFFKSLLKQLLINPYSALIRLLLERACK